MARVAVAFTNSIITSPALNAETIIATTGPLNLVNDQAAVFLFGFLVINMGASSVSLRVNIRRGIALTSTLVNVAQNFTAAAANTLQANVNYFDVPGPVAEVQYSITASCVSATGASTVFDVCLMAMVL